VRIRVLDFDDDEARKVWSGPLLVKIVRLLLLNAVVARQLESFTVVGLEIRIRRRFAKAIEISGEMAVHDDERITSVGMLVETRGQQDVRTEMHRTSPELRQAFALNLQVPDVFRVFRRFDWRNG